MDQITSYDRKRNSSSGVCRRALRSPAFFLTLIVPIGFILIAGPTRAKPIRVEDITLELITASPTIHPPQPFEVGLRMKQDPGWHTYWINPASAGYITKFELDLPAGFAAGPLVPAPPPFSPAAISG